MITYKPNIRLELFQLSFSTLQYCGSDLTSINPQIISAAALTAESQIIKDTVNPKKISGNLNNSDMSDVQKGSEGTLLNIEIQDLGDICEGTEIEKSVLGDMLNFECSKNNEAKHKSTKLFTSVNDNYEDLDLLEESSLLNLPSEPKRRRYSPNEDKPVEPVPVEVKDSDLDRLGQSTECLEGTEIDVSSENGQVNTKDYAQCSDSASLYMDSDFKNIFRMSRATFQILIGILSEEELEPIEDVPLDKKVLIVLWLLGTSGSHSDAAEKFGVSEEAVASCFFDICATLYNKSENFIKWPTSEESDEIASRIEENFGFPGVIGVLGYHYFTISIPKETLSRREYFNGKLRMYCVTLKLMCDDQFVIRDIFPGSPGGIRPAQVLRDSPLGELLTTQPTQLVDPNKHILARSEFPQLSSMLTPYKQSESLTKDEAEFNVLHENVCLLVDQTFQMLKDRFRILKLLDPEVATMVLVTTCVLHNICVQNGDTYDPEESD